MNEYLSNIQSKVDAYANKQKYSIKIKEMLEKYLSRPSFIAKFIKDREILFLLSVNVNNKNKEDYDKVCELIKDLSLVPENLLIKDSEITKIEDTKSKLKKYLTNLKNSFETLSKESFKDINLFHAELSKIGKDSKVNIKLITAYMYKVGFNTKEINDFLAYYAKENMGIYERKVKEIDSNAEKVRIEMIDKNNKANMRRIKRENKKNALINVCSPATDELLKKVSMLLDKYKNILIDKQIVNSYELFYLDSTIDFDLLLQDKSALDKILMCIKSEYDFIESVKSEFSENDAKIEIEKLSKLYTNYQKALFIKNNRAQDIQKMENIFNNEEQKINVHFLVNEKNGKSYFEMSIEENKDMQNYKNNAETFIEKIKSGVVKIGHQNHVLGIEDNVFWARQGKVYICYYPVTESDWIVLTSAKYEDYEKAAEQVYNTCYDQIENIKKNIGGSSI